MIEELVKEGIALILLLCGIFGIHHIRNGGKK